MQYLKQTLILILLLPILSSCIGPAKPVPTTGENQNQARATADTIFADGFEAGSLSAWTANQTDSGDLKASTPAAIRGGFGVQALVDDNNSIFLTDDTPNAEPRYRARFYFDANSIKMSSGNAFFLLKGFEGSSSLTVRIEFRMYSTGYQVRAGLIKDGSSWVNSNWFPISDAIHFIEMDWRAATGAGKNDGGLTLWIDGTQKANLTGIDNDTWRIDRVRLGAVSGIDSGTRGTFYMDEFESRRQSYIGPAGNFVAPTASPTMAAGQQNTPVPGATNTPQPTATLAAVATPTAAQPTNIRIPFSPSNEDFANPERGFMKQSSVFPDESLSLNKVNILQSSDSLVWIYFRLDNYRDRLLDQTALNTIQSVFSTARSRGLKLVIRFVYNPGPGSTSDPNLAQPDAPINLVLQHIEQLKPLLRENADVIAVVQAGFVGHWGEWHSTKYLHPLEYRRAIVDALLTALPQDRMLQLRYPRFKQIFYGGPLTEAQAFSGSDQSRVGVHNDCFLAGTTDSGTYESSSPQLPKIASTYCDGQDATACWKGYLVQESRFTPVGGETCSYNPPRTDCQNALQELETFHWSFLNNGYKADVLNSWTAGGCMDIIRRRLGYRFVLEDATLPSSVRSGGTLGITIRLTNQGFAAIYNPRPVFLVLQGTANRYEFPITPIDPRRWEPGKDQSLSINVTLPTSVPAGAYKLALWLPDAAQSLRNMPAYAVRFANTGVWDAATGMNILTNTLQVMP